MVRLNSQIVLPGVDKLQSKRCGPQKIRSARRHGSQVLVEYGLADIHSVVVFFPAALIAENLFLRKQIALFRERKAKPRRTTASFRLTMVGLAQLFDWRGALVIAEAGVPLTTSTAGALAELNVYHRQFNVWETVPDEVRPALAALRARGLRLVVVSNANGTLLSAFTRLGLVDAFDVIFDSHVVGIEKPDPRFFHLALERSGARAETTVHVGDLYHVDVAGARAAGISAILFDVADLYAEYDCPRVSSLDALVGLVTNHK